jgi:nucleotide-binding universal stress UspA family protein
MKDNMKILVGVDGSEHSRWALLEAVNIAKKFSGVVKVITVYNRSMKQQAENILREAEERLESEGVRHSSSSILGSNASRALVNTAKQGSFDLIVVGSRGLGSAAAFLLGSVSRQVVTKASCDVLVVKK